MSTACRLPPTMTTSSFMSSTLNESTPTTLTDWLSESLLSLWPPAADHHDVGRLALHEVGIDLLVRDGLHAGELKLAFKVASQIPQPLVGALVGFGGRQQASKRPLLLVQGDVVTAQRRYAGGLHAGRAPPTTMTFLLASAGTSP